MAQQHGCVHTQVELGIARRLHHGRRTDQPHHVTVLAGLRLHVAAQVDHLAAMPGRRGPIIEQAACRRRHQPDPGQHQQGADYVQGQSAREHAVA
jgi:hypothetical protein